MVFPAGRTAIPGGPGPPLDLRKAGQNFRADVRFAGDEPVKAGRDVFAILPSFRA